MGGRYQEGADPYSPMNRRSAPRLVQPSWLQRDGAEMVEKIRREAVTEEHIYDNVRSPAPATP
eukprot:6921737-Pyramimonas_sp.AAC.1